MEGVLGSSVSGYKETHYNVINREGGLQSLALTKSTFKMLLNWILPWYNRSIFLKRVLEAVSTESWHNKVTMIEIGKDVSSK
jgi:hypothetical protein